MALVPMLYQASFSGKSFGAVFARMVDLVDVAHVFPEAVGLLHVLVADGALELGVLPVRVGPRVLGQRTLGLEALAALLANVLTERFVVVYLGMVVPGKKKMLNWV